MVNRFHDNPISAFADLYRLLSKMATAAEIQYNTKAIQEIVACAEKHGGAAKPSGAGGGDCVVALFPNVQSQQSFQQDCPFPTILAEPCEAFQIHKES